MAEDKVAPEKNHCPGKLRTGVIFRGLCVVALASLLSFALHKSGWLAIFENATLDLVSQTRHLSLRQIARHIMIVEINNDDYRTLFHGKSPLDTAALSKILEAMAAGEPNLIVVDIDTSSIEHKELKLPDFKGKIIWANSWTELSADKTAPLVGAVTAEALPLLPLSKRTILIPGGVLGGRDYSGMTGLAFLPADADGSVRRYCRRLQTLEKTSGEVGLADSLPWIVAKSYKPELAGKESQEENEVAIAYLKDNSLLPVISAGELLDSFDKPGWKEIARGKIVILGGTFDAARDEYKTRMGRCSGVGLIAQVVSTELDSGGIRIVSDSWLLAAQLIVGTLYLFLNTALSRPWWLLAGLVLIPFASVGFSALALSNLSLWANFVPTLFVIQIYALYEHIQDIRNKNDELESTNRALRDARMALARGVDELSQDERRRVSERLHDQTMMDLFQIEVALTPLSDSTDTEQVYQEALEKVQTTRRNVREIMENLFPSVLRNASLIECIASLCNSLSTANIKIDFSDSTDGAGNNLEESDQYRVFRIIQNALRNAMQHAEASEIFVEARFEDGNLAFLIEDDGKGFDGNSVRIDSQGLANMRASAELLDGTITWKTPAERFAKGTAVRLLFPLKTKS